MPTKWGRANGSWSEVCPATRGIGVSLDVFYPPLPEGGGAMPAGCRAAPMTTGHADVVRVSDAAQPPTTSGPADVVRVPDVAQPPGFMAQHT